MLMQSTGARSADTKDFDINAAFDEFMHGIGLSPDETGGRITFIGSDPIFESRHRIGACISIPIMAAAALTVAPWRLRPRPGPGPSRPACKSSSTADFSC